MKKLLVLPGNSPRNKDWGEGCVAAYGGWFDASEVLSYDHWRTGEKWIDIETELEKIKVLVATEPETEWYISAKSIGTLLALLVIHRKVIAPHRCIFFGMPLDGASENLFKDSWEPLASLRVPTLAFHNENDPTAGFEFTKQILGEHNPTVEFVVLPGDNHDYLDFVEYQERVKEFFQL